MNLKVKERYHIEEFRKAFYEITEKDLQLYSIAVYKSKEDYGEALEDLMAFLKEENMSICKIFKHKSCETEKYFIKETHFLIRKDNTYAVVGLSFNASTFNVVIYNITYDYIKEYFIINKNILNQCTTLCLE